MVGRQTIKQTYWTGTLQSAHSIAACTALLLENAHGYGMPIPILTAIIALHTSASTKGTLCTICHGIGMLR